MINLGGKLIFSTRNFLKYNELIISWSELMQQMQTWAVFTTFIPLLG